MHILTVSLGARSYPIHIGEGLLQKPDALIDCLPQPRVAIVTNTTVAPLYLAALTRVLATHDVEAVPIVLPDGEAHKNWKTLNLIFDALLAHRCERKTTLIALGGGVIGDMAGFAAATYLRGVPFIQIPTTLLAQVDSSVGGKTGINHPAGKNMIGAFYQPRLVLADTATLATLPDRELSAGLAEVIKYGLIRDPSFFEWLEKNIEVLFNRDSAALAHAIQRSCQIKAEIVAEDEHENAVRALLNLGHTFGHAIETGLGYGEWLHGEAIAAGTLQALDLSRRLGYIGAVDVNRAADLYRRARLPVAAPDLGVGRYLKLMGHDKKVEDGKLRLVLLKRIGDAFVTGEFPHSALIETLEVSGAPAHV
ncbi:MAG: 3-dehydroquinate synthase [Pseudomonadota bacterium]|nr:3-dehydroquinate synthase [Pseudomonadota bacterium]